MAKRSPKTRPVVEMFLRYAAKNDLLLKPVEYFGNATNMTFFHELEKHVIDGTTVYGEVPSWKNAVHVVVTLSDEDGRAFRNTLRMLEEMAAVKVKREYSTDNSVKYTLYR